MFQPMFSLPKSFVKPQLSMFEQDVLWWSNSILGGQTHILSNPSVWLILLWIRKRWSWGQFYHHCWFQRCKNPPVSSNLCWKVSPLMIFPAETSMDFRVVISQCSTNLPFFTRFTLFNPIDIPIFLIVDSLISHEIPLILSTMIYEMGYESTINNSYDIPLISHSYPIVVVGMGSSCWSHQQCCEGLNASIRVRPSSFLSFCGRSAWGGPKGTKHLECGKMMKHAVEIFCFFIFVKMVVDFMSICSIHWFTWITWKLKWLQPHLVVLYLYSNHSVSSLKQQKRTKSWSTDHPHRDPASSTLATFRVSVNLRSRVTTCGGFHSHGGTPLSLDGLFHGKCHENAWVGGTFSGNLHVTTEEWRLMNRLDWRFFAMAKKTGNLEVKSKGANINPYHMTSQNWFIYIFSGSPNGSFGPHKGQMFRSLALLGIGRWDYLQKIHLSFIYLVIINFDDIFEAFSILHSFWLVNLHIMMDPRARRE